MSAFLLPLSLFAMVTQNFEYSGTLCNVQGFFFTVLIVTQQLALLIISIDRNYAIMNSLRYPNVFTQTLCIILITFSWLFAFVISAPPLLNSGLGQYNFHKTYFLCTLDWTVYSGYLVSFAVIVFGIPISVQSLCYIRIFIAAVGHTKRTAKVNPWVGRSSRQQIENESSSGSNGSTEPSSSSMECKAVRTIFIIALAFVTCWVPYFIESFVSLRGYSTSPTFSAAVICFLFSTGILNPLIYAFMNRVTRREIGRFVCGNSASNDSDEFVSTSMSTHTSNWSSQNNKFRGRNIGVGNTDMHTIIEENEDSSVFAKEVANLADPAALPSVKTEPKPSKKPSITHTEKITVHTDSHTSTNSTEIVVETADETLTNTVVDASVRPSTSKDKSVSIGSARVLGDSHWKIVNSDKFKEERRRYSSKQFNADLYFGKQKRRTRRDCGSFLFFEHTDQFPTLSKTRREKNRPERFSVDHIQSVSVGKFPTFMKLKLSLNETDLHRFNKVTVQSNIEIENKTYKGNAEDIAGLHDSNSSIATSGSSPTGSPTSPVPAKQWQEHEVGAKKSAKRSTSSLKDNPHFAKPHAKSNTDSHVVSFSTEGKENKFRERFRSEPFATGLQHCHVITPQSLRIPKFNETNTRSPFDDDSEALDQYLD